MNFNFTSQICTTNEQSERLLALGLRKETADMCIDNMGNIYTYPITIIETIKNDWGLIPLWSLHRLMEIYTNGFSDSNWNMAQFNWNILIDCIECRIHEGYCNKEYLEQ